MAPTRSHYTSTPGCRGDLTASLCPEKARAVKKQAGSKSLCPSLLPMLWLAAHGPVGFSLQPLSPGPFSFPLDIYRKGGGEGSQAFHTRHLPHWYSQAVNQFCGCRQDVFQVTTLSPPPTLLEFPDSGWLRGLRYAPLEAWPCVFYRLRKQEAVFLGSAASSPHSKVASLGVGLWNSESQECRVVSAPALPWSPASASLDQGSERLIGT